MKTRSFLLGAAAGLAVAVISTGVVWRELQQTRHRLIDFEMKEAAMAAHRAARVVNDAEIKLDMATERLEHA